MRTARGLLFAIYFLFSVIVVQSFKYSCKTSEEETGFCVSVEECQTLLTITNSGEASNKKSTCRNTDGEYTKVCCPSKIISRVTERRQHNHKSAEILPDANCGYESASRSRNTEASIRDYSWLVLLKYEKDDNSYICGGALISKNYVITSAHCIQNKYKLISARFNEYDVRTDEDCIKFPIGRNKDSIIDCKLPYQDFDISSEDTIVHPNYSVNTKENDIGLIRLKKDVDISRNFVFPICLPSILEEESSEPVVFAAAGWGATNLGLSSPVLLQGYVRKEEVETSCVKPNGVNLTVNDIFTSIRYTGRKCVTDDGGPLMSYSGKKSRFYLSGIATRMPSTCDADEIFVGYIKIRPYVKWILDHINS